ncbi:hypothetical protein GCM10010349_26930 [Streptomyces flavofungini]|nr:hypothetical protein GCM10010349_26930 [Streptomyces flavofungini]
MTTATLPVKREPDGAAAPGVRRELPDSEASEAGALGFTCGVPSCGWAARLLPGARAARRCRVDGPPGSGDR